MIGNLRYLTDPEAKPDPKVRIPAEEKDSMSRHIAMSQDDRLKYVFGWDQPLQSYYLQIHDLTLSEDEQIVVWQGATKETAMPNMIDLFRLAKTHGLYLGDNMRAQLYAEKDNGV